MTTAPILTSIRETRSFMRSTAFAVLIAFLMLILEPAVAAAQATPTQPATPAEAATSDDQHFSQTLQKIEDKLQRIQDKLTKQQDHAAERGELKQLQAALKQLDGIERQGFAKVEQHLTDHKLPSELFARHQEMVDNYQAEYGKLMAELETLGSAKTDGETLNSVNKMLEGFKAKPNHRPEQPFDPNDLPVQTPSGKIRAPKETKEELQKLVQVQDAPIQVAALELNAGMLAIPTMSILATTPAPADLAETEDVQINDTIKEIAKDLENNPIKIYNWVRNSIEFVPTYGSIQGAQQTYENLKGNAFDTASLLIATLRAAKIPARYVYGTIQVPADQVMNWVGGAKTPEIAQSLLGQSGIPAIGLVSGGKIVAFKMEHVWVEAYVDFIPSRGAKHISGDTWVPMDASFKQYDYVDGLEGSVSVPDAQSLMTQFSALGTIDQTNSTISGFTPEDYRAIADPIISNTTAYIDTKAPDATIEEFLGSKTIRQSDLPVLAASLPYKTLAATTGISELPDRMRHRATIQVFSNQIDLASESPSISYTISLPKLNGRRLSVKYTPASSADEQVIQNAISSGAKSIPAYLVKLKTAIQIDDTKVAEGSIVGMGADQTYQITINDPQSLNTKPVTLRGVAGDVGIFSIDAIGLEMGSIAARHRSYVALDMENKKVTEKLNRKTPEEGLFLTALSYWEQYTSFDRMLAHSVDTLALRLPSVGHFLHPAAITYSFGMPWKASYGSTQVNIPRVYIAAAAKDNSERRAFIMASGIYGSTMEGLVLDQVNSRPAGTGVSAIRALALTLTQGKKIISINQDNVETQLAKVQASNTIKNEIRNAAAAGLSTVIPESGISHRGWVGTGYVILDQGIGTGAYRISEGLNGGGIFEPATANVSSVGSYGKNGFLGSIGSAGAMAQQAEKVKSAQNTARAFMTLMRTAVGPMAVGAGIVLIAYFVSTAIFIHQAKIEEAVENDTAVAESATDFATTQEPAQCSYVIHGRKPPLSNRTDFWAVRTQQHHACADDNTQKDQNGREFSASYRNWKRSFDTMFGATFADPPLNAILTGVAKGGEVKTTGSTLSFPGPDALGYYLVALSNQIAIQQKIAQGCGFGYELIVQEEWQVLIAQLLYGYTVRIGCPSKGIDPPSTTGLTAFQKLLGIYGDLYLDALE